MQEEEEEEEEEEEVDIQSHIRASGVRKEWLTPNHFPFSFFVFVLPSFSSYACEWDQEEMAYTFISLSLCFPRTLMTINNKKSGWRACSWAGSSNVH